MRRRLYSIVPLALLLSGCFGDGRDAIQLFINVNAATDCPGGVQLHLNLDRAGAVLLRESDGSIRCDLTEALEDSGCSLELTEVDGGEILQVDITGCTTPDVGTLLQCEFEEVDASNLGEETSALCLCVQNNCSGFQPVCVNESDDPGSCETCDNEIDDDGNGNTDCEDENCTNSPHCPFVSTTSTTTSTSTSVSHTFSFFDCDLTFRLSDEVLLGALQWETDYSDLRGMFPGHGASVNCSSPVEGVLASFNDDGLTETLRAGLISVPGFQGPLDLAHCVISVPFEPEPGDFSVTVLDASDPGSQPVELFPQVEVFIHCGTH